MSIVLSLVAISPPPRYDGVPWTHVRIEESPGPQGPWTQIDLQMLADPDDDPSAPAVRSFTTDDATLTLAWYHAIFVDDAGHVSEPLGLQRNSVLDSPLPPSPDEIRQASPLLRSVYPAPAGDPFQLADLRLIVYEATAYVQSMTFRLIDPSLGDVAPEGYLSEAVPDGLIPLAFTAIARMSERIKVTTDPAMATQIATGRRLRGFTAGPYSEQYFAPGEFARRGASQGRPPMDVDDALDSALWALATEDARDYFVWRSTGVAPPVGVATSFDYRRQSIGYGSGGMGGGFGGMGHGGPDGF